MLSEKCEVVKLRYGRFNYTPIKICGPKIIIDKIVKPENVVSMLTVDEYLEFLKTLSKFNLIKLRIET